MKISGIRFICTLLIQRRDLQQGQAVFRDFQRQLFSVSTRFSLPFPKTDRLDRLRELSQCSVSDRDDPIRWLHPAELVDELRDPLRDFAEDCASQGHRARLILDGLDFVAEPETVLACFEDFDADLEIIIATRAENSIASFVPDRVIDIGQCPELAAQNARSELFLREAGESLGSELESESMSAAQLWWSSLGPELASVIAMMATLLVAKGPLTHSELMALSRAAPELALRAFIRLQSFSLFIDRGFVGKLEDLWALWLENPRGNFDLSEHEVRLLNVMTAAEDPRRWPTYGRQFALAHDRALRAPLRFASRLADPRFLAATLTVSDPLSVLRECDALLRQHPHFFWPPLARLALSYFGRRLEFFREHPETIEQELRNDWRRWTVDLGANRAREESLGRAESLSAPWLLIEGTPGRSGVSYDSGCHGLTLCCSDTVVLSCSSKSLHVWDGETGAELGFVPELAVGAVVAGSRDGRWAALVNSNLAFPIVDLRRERCVHVLPALPYGPFAFFGLGAQTELLRVHGASFSVTAMETFELRMGRESEGSLITALAENCAADSSVFFGTETGEVELWSLAELRCLRRWRAHDSRIGFIVCLSGGTRAVTTSSDGTLALWDLTTNAELRRINLGGEAQAIDVDSKGQRAALFCDGEPGCFVVNLETGSREKSLPTTAARLAFAFINERKVLVAQGTNDHHGPVWSGIWDLDSDKGLEIEDWRVSPWAPILRTAQGSIFGKLAHWGLGVLRSSSQASEVLIPSRDLCDAASIDQKRGQALFLTRNPAIELWDLTSHRCVQRYEADIPTKFSHCFALQESIYGLSPGGELIVWDRQTSKPLKRLGGLPSYTCSMKLLGNENSVGLGLNGSWQLWDFGLGQCRSKFDSASGSAIFDLAPYQGGVLSVSDSALIEHWDLKTGEGRRWNRDPADSIHCLDVDGQRPWILTGSEDGGLRVWEAATGRLLRLMKANASWLTQILAFPDRRLVLAAYEDSSLRLWDIETGRCLSMTELPARVAAMAWVGGQAALIVDEAAQKRLLRFEPEPGEAGAETLEVLMSRRVDEIPGEKEL